VLYQADLPDTPIAILSALRERTDVWQPVLNQREAICIGLRRRCGAKRVLNTIVARQNLLQFDCSIRDSYLSTKIMALYEIDPNWKFLCHTLINNY